MTFNPFADETASLSIAGLTVENHEDRVALYGSLDLTRDRPGLARARQLKTLLEHIVAALEKTPDLPETVAAPDPTVSVKNPFQ